MSRSGLGAVIASCSGGLSVISLGIAWTSGPSWLTFGLLGLAAALLLLGTGMIIGSRG